MGRMVELLLFFLRPSSRLRRSGCAYVLLLCVCIADDMQNPLNTPSYKLDIPKIFLRYPQPKKGLVSESEGRVFSTAPIF